MAILLSVEDLEKSFAHRPLFQGLKFGIESGERVGLIGPNGAGKSTLLKIIAGLADPDSGRVSRMRGLNIGYLPQVPDLDLSLTVEQAVLAALRDPNDWQQMAEAQSLLSRMELGDGEQVLSELSGGRLKRVALACAIVRQPDLLLLDEPTNHLDVEGVEWLEEFLESQNFATLTITHDRLFLQRVSRRILELDPRNPGGILNIRGDYLAYLEAKQQLLDGQQNREQKLRNSLKRETEWLRRGAQARQTKQQARIEAHADLANQVDELATRNRQRKVEMEFVGNENRPKKLIEAQEIEKQYGGKIVVPKISLLITPKSRIGLLGANGSGKSTLLKILIGEVAPDRGKVVASEHLSVAYFAQNRESLNPEVSVLKTICPIGDFVDFGGQKVHARSYLNRFLFGPLQMDMPVGKLSGGEQSRLVIAKMMLTQANVLILDEPTNDLDISTLDVLQEVIGDFPGAVLLVSHDRYFMDQVCNQILAFAVDSSGNKTIETFADLNQWQLSRRRDESQQLAAAKASSVSAATAPARPKTGDNRLQRQLDKIMAQIEKLESELSKLAKETYSDEVGANMLAKQQQVDDLYQQWEKLSQSSGG